MPTVDGAGGSAASAEPRGGVRVGICGFRGGQNRAFREHDLIEVQQTFYQPPKPETAARWRERAGPGVTFTIKAWQLITHPPTSPTYRRLTESLTDAERRSAGGMRWNAVTRRAWARTREIAAALDAEAVVFQTPPSFTPGENSLARLRELFSAIERDARTIVFEPRGRGWDDELLASLCAGLDVVHGVDPFLRAPADDGPRYFRLHGRPAYNYRYRYTDAELDELAARLDRDRPVRVLFNNDAMADDAVRLRERLSGA